MIIESMISEKREYETKGGLVINNSFVPSLVNKKFADMLKMQDNFRDIYQQYSEKALDKDYQKLLKKDEEKMKEFTDLFNTFNEIGNDLQELQEDLLETIINKNDNGDMTLEDALNNMDSTDIMRFLSMSCVGVLKKEKKNYQK